MLGVRQGGYFAWKDRPACRRQRDNLVLLAHARAAFALSNGTDGSPRMTRELQDNDFVNRRSNGGSDSLSVHRSSLCGHQAGFEQIEIGATVRLAFDELQTGDLTFDLTA